MSRFDQCAVAGFGVQQLMFSRLALCDVSNQAGEHTLAADRHFRNAQRYLDNRAVAVPAFDLVLPGVRVDGLFDLKHVRHQGSEMVCADLLCQVTEQPFSRWVESIDQAIFIDYYDAFGGGIYYGSHMSFLVAETLEHLTERLGEVTDLISRRWSQVGKIFMGGCTATTEQFLKRTQCLLHAAYRQQADDGGNDTQCDPGDHISCTHLTGVQPMILNQHRIRQQWHQSSEQQRS